MQFFKPRVYADAAAATPLSSGAHKELSRLLYIYGNPSGLHKEALAAKSELESAREKVAEVLGAHADEIVFTSGGTEANTLALAGALGAIVDSSWQAQVITSSIEHPSVLEPLRAIANEEKIVLHELVVDERGIVSTDLIKETITDDTVLISVQLINSEIGTIQNIREIAKLVRHVRRERNSRSEGMTWPSGPERPSGGISLPLLLHVDASQAPLWMKLGVEQLGVDLMTLDGQKICGPKGVGALFVRRGINLMPQVLGGGQERGLRSGTENVPLIGSFTVALAEAQANAEKNSKMISFVRDFMWSEIKKNIPQAELNGAEGEARVANNCNISIPGLVGDMAVLSLDAHGVAASTRSACSTEDEAPSYVIRGLGKSPEMARGAIRLTLLPTATMADARHIAQLLKKVVNRYANVLQ
jgi:cysteine desulfurase